MEKIKIKYKLSSNDNSYCKEVLGVINDNIISYKEENGTYVDIDIKNNKLLRENKEMILKYEFDQKKGFILVKDINKEVEIVLDIVKLDRQKYKYLVQYLIEEDEFKFELEYGEVK